MTETETTDDKLADLLGVHRSAISRWRRGVRVPEPAMLRAIREATDGAVSANDFVHTDAA